MHDIDDESEPHLCHIGCWEKGGGGGGGGLQFASESILLLWYKCSYMCLSGQHFVKKFCICPLD